MRKAARERERESAEKRKRRRRRKVGGVWLPSTSLLALLPLRLPHLFFLLDTLDTHHIRDARGEPAFTPWVSFHVRAYPGELKNTGGWCCAFRCHERVFFSLIIYFNFTRSALPGSYARDSNAGSCSVTAVKSWRMIDRETVRKESVAGRDWSLINKESGRVCVRARALKCAIRARSKTTKACCIKRGCRWKRIGILSYEPPESYSLQT